MRHLEQLRIYPVSSVSAEECESLMAGNEPWATLGYTASDFLNISRGSQAHENIKAELNGETIGLSCFKLGFMRGAFMSLIVVRRDHRASGVGTLLMDFVEASIFARTQNVFSSFASFNRDAQRFFRRRGYTRVGRIKQLLVPEHDEILIRKCRADLVTRR